MQWYQNGQIPEKGEYQNGKKEGGWISYEKGEYQNDRLVNLFL